MLNPARDFDQDCTLLFFFPGTPALGTGLSDNLALTATVGTGGSISEAAEDALLYPSHLSGTVTVGALAGLTACPATGTVAL